VQPVNPIGYFWATFPIIWRLLSQTSGNAVHGPTLPNEIVEMSKERKGEKERKRIRQSGRMR